MSQKQALLLLNGSKYDLQLVLRLAGSCPQVSMAISDINDDSNPEHKVSYEGVDYDPTQGQSVLFYKQHGKFTMLTGQDMAKQFMQDPRNTGIKGRIVSSVMLKKARIEDPNAVEESTPAPTYEPEFANRPRWQNDRNNHRPQPTGDNRPARTPWGPRRQAA